MATKVIEYADAIKIAKALIANVDSLWVLVCGDYKIGIKNAILVKVRELGIESESQLYRDIQHSICDVDEMKNRNILWKHELIVCPLDGLIKDAINNKNDISFVCVEKIGG